MTDFDCSGTIHSFANVPGTQVSATVSRKQIERNTVLNEEGSLMFEEIIYSVKLSRLQKSKRAISKFHDARLRAFRKTKDYERMNEGSIIHDEMQELELVDDEIVNLQTQFLINQTDRYCLPHANFIDAKSLEHDWYESRIHPGRYRLKPEVIVRMRAAIRAEQKERWEYWTRWVPLLTGLTGLFGTLIGLATVIARWF